MGQGDPTGFDPLEFSIEFLVAMPLLVIISIRGKTIEQSNNKFVDHQRMYAPHRTGFYKSA